MAKKGQKFKGDPGKKVPRGMTKIVFKAKHQRGNTVKDWDKKLRAEVPGKRISRNEHPYYEYRANRSDMDPDAEPDKL